MAAFFVVVVPVNLLVLRKIKRGELAWITAPIISACFAGYILSLGKDLYTAKLSRAVDGTLFVQQARQMRIFEGTSQLFFPNGGNYDPKMPAVETLSLSENDDGYSYGYNRRPSSSAFTAEDRGQITVPRVSVNNLSFEQLGFQQHLVSPKTLTVGMSSDLRSVKITNVSGQVFKGGQLLAGGTATNIRALKPGQSETVKLPKQDTTDHFDTEALRMTKRNGNAYITGEFDSLVVGPQIGDLVPAHTHFKLVYAFYLPAGVYR